MHSRDHEKMGEALKKFDGATFVPELDGARLTTQQDRVECLMKDGLWRMLSEIATVLNEPQASVSARLRDLRKTRFGGYTVERRRRGNPRDGLFEYRALKQVASGAA